MINVVFLIDLYMVVTRMSRLTCFY